MATVRFVNIMLAGLLAGVSCGIWLGFNPKDLSPSTYLEQQQNMLHALRVLMVVLVMTTTIVTLTSAILQRHNKRTFSALLLAAVFFVACIVITAFGNRPIDNTVLTWTSSSLPGNWTDIRDKWWALHIARTIAELAGLVLVTWTGVSKAAAIGRDQEADIHQ